MIATQAQSIVDYLKGTLEAKPDVEAEKVWVEVLKGHEHKEVLALAKAFALSEKAKDQRRWPAISEILPARTETKKGTINPCCPYCKQAFSPKDLSLTCPDGTRASFYWDALTKERVKSNYHTHVDVCATNDSKRRMKEIPTERLKELVRTLSRKNAGFFQNGLRASYEEELESRGELRVPGDDLETDVHTMSRADIELEGIDVIDIENQAETLDTNGDRIYSSRHEEDRGSTDQGLIPLSEVPF